MGQNMLGNQIKAAQRASHITINKQKATTRIDGPTHETQENIRTTICDIQRQLVRSFGVQTQHKNQIIPHRTKTFAALTLSMQYMFE